MFYRLGSLAVDDEQPDQTPDTWCCAGPSRTELEMIGRGGGPSPGNKAPASANVHQCKQSAARPFDQFPDLSTRGRSMPSQDLVKLYSCKAAAQGLSLGIFSVDRKDLVLPVSPRSGIANGAHKVSDAESQEPQGNPFACIAT